MPKWMDLVAGLCLGLVVLGGAYLFYLGLRNLWWAWASRSWPVADGVVAASRTESTVSRDSNTGVRSTMHEARLSFSFSVRGAGYETTKLFFGQTGASGDSSEAELLHLRYPEGAPVRISFDPADPSRAVVKPGLYADALWLPGAGLVLILIGTMFLIMYFSSQYRDSGMALGVALFAAIFGLGGAAMLAAGGHNLWLGYSSRSWPSAAGEVVYSAGESSESVSTDDEGNRTRSTTFSTRIVFKYDAAGATRYGNLRHFGQISGSSQEWAGQIAALYPKGQPVRVAYRPGDEDTSVLETGIRPDAWWIPGIGLACLLFALAVGLIVVPAMNDTPQLPSGFSLSARKGPPAEAPPHHP